MPRRLPPLNSLRAFEAAARLASFQAAAEELHVTQGAISRHVRQLEDWLGRELFERLHRRVALTETGAAYFAEIGDIFDRIALATARQIERGPQRVLRVDALGTFTLRWLIPKLSRFQLAHPGVELRLTTSSTPVAAAGRDADVVIRGGPQVLDGWRATEFLAEGRLPVCSPALLAREPIAEPRDLRRHTLLHTASLPQVWNDWLALAGAADVQPQRSLTLEHFHLTLQGALDGLGLAIGPTALVADAVAEGRLVFPFAGPMLPPWRYFAYVRDEQAEDAAVQLFIGWLEQMARATAPTS